MAALPAPAPASGPTIAHDDVPPALRPKQRRTEKPIKTIAFVVLVGLLVGFGVMYVIGKRQQPATRAKCIGQCILLRSNGADPGALTVTSGSLVEFASADGQRHNLALDNADKAHDPGAALNASHSSAGGGFESGEFKADEAWRVQFKQDGAYAFTDKLNPKIHVDIVVYTPGKDYKIE